MVYGYGNIAMGVGVFCFFCFFVYYVRTTTTISTITITWVVGGPIRSLDLLLKID